MSNPSSYSGLVLTLSIGVVGWSLDVEKCDSQISTVCQELASIHQKEIFFPHTPGIWNVILRYAEYLLQGYPVWIFAHQS